MNVAKKILVFFIFLILIPIKLAALENKILFKINNKIITTYDINSEIKYLYVLNNEIKNLEDKKIFELAKNSIIKHAIKENELKKFYKEIKFDKVFLEKFIINYFSNYKFNSIDELKLFLNEKGINFSDLEKKITIQLMWNQIILKKYSNEVKIDKELIRENIAKKKLQEEILISEIVFNIVKKNELEQKYRLIQNEIEKSNFSTAAIIYSVSESSINGGKIGWIKTNSLSKQIKNKVKNIKIGEITKPIQIPGGFIVLKIEDKRETEIKLDINKEIKKIIKNKTNEQLNQFSNIYFNKIKKDIKIDKL
tara:strand:- start:631 stop:1557 length:927 start_codon:yes stop_codon:yes gene_type:complete